MFNVIRIPTKFSKPISRLSDKDQLRLYKLIRDIGDGRIVGQPDDGVGDLLSLIYAEWMNMEIRNGYKRECSHLSNPEGVGESCPSDSGHRVEYSIVEDNRVEDNIIENNTCVLELEKILEFWNEELGRKYEKTEDLKKAYKNLRKKEDKELVEEVIMNYVDKCKNMEEKYHLSPYKFFTQKNGFISIKNS